MRFSTAPPAILMDIVAPRAQFHNGRGSCLSQRSMSLVTVAAECMCYSSLSLGRPGSGGRRYSRLQCGELRNDSPASFEVEREIMKPVFIVVILIGGLALGQEKPRVFVQGRGSENITTSGAGGGGSHWGSWGARSSLDSHDESMQVTRELQKECSDVIVTLNQSNADYTVMLNRESKHNRGLLRTNSQVQVANRLGDVIGTNATRTVGNASKDACELIVADWGQHGRIAGPDTTSSATAPPVVPTTVSAPAEAAKVEKAPPDQAQNATGVAGSTSGAPPPAKNSDAKLQIDSSPPGADIEVDGSFVGNTPSDVQVAEGDHTIVVKKSGFKNWERKLKSSAGSSVHIGAELEKADNQ